MKDLTEALDKNNQAKAFKIASEATLFNHANPIIKGLSLIDKDHFTQDKTEMKNIAVQYYKDDLKNHQTN